MNVLQVIPYFAERRGGDVDACLNISRQLVRRGHRVTILTTDLELDKRRVDTVEASGINLVAFHSVANVQLLLVSPGIRKWLDKNINGFDLAHLHTFRAYQNYLLHRYAKKYKVPYILEAHGSVLPFFQKRLQKKVYDLLWGRALLEDAARVIALTQQEAEQYKNMHVREEKIDIVPNGIDLSQYVHLPNTGTFKSRYSIENDVCLVLFLGRLHKIKGADLLLKAFARLAEKKDKLKLVIAGPDAGYSAHLKRLTDSLNIRDLVLFTGPLYGQDKLEAFVDADVYVLPSIHDTFPVTVLEACACGTPVISTTACGIADLVERFGYVVDLSVKDMCGAMFRILNDEKMRAEFGAEGKRLVREELNWDKISQRMDQIYNDVIANHVRG
jgi:glycosyltransferase involved in cell wall biosynthesis